MQIELVYRKGENPIMIELHGSLDSALQFDGQLLGCLQWLTEKEAMLAVGTQIIRGKLVELDQPLLLVKPHNVDELEETDGGEVEVSHIVTQKLVFNSKPVDIIDTLMPKLESKEDGTLSQMSQ